MVFPSARDTPKATDIINAKPNFILHGKMEAVRTKKRIDILNVGKRPSGLKDPNLSSGPQLRR